MVLGMSISSFTLVHVVISLIGIATGFVVLWGLLNSRALPGWTMWFLVTTILTSVTGYFFPVEHILPSHIVGAISLALLAVAVAALYGLHLAGSWRWLYVASAVAALYLNTFVLVFQTFLKIPALKATAPTASEPPFVAAHAFVLIAFVVLGLLAARRFHPAGAIGKLGAA